MNDNHQTQGIHKCSGCSKTIPTGKEIPCYTTDGIHQFRQLFCYVCKISRGKDFSTLHYEPNFEKLKVMEAIEFKRYKENTQFSENVEELKKELEDDWQERLKKGGKIF